MLCFFCVSLCALFTGTKKWTLRILLHLQELVDYFPFQWKMDKPIVRLISLSLMALFPLFLKSVKKVLSAMFVCEFSILYSFACVSLLTINWIICHIWLVSLSLVIGMQIYDLHFKSVGQIYA